MNDLHGRLKELDHLDIPDLSADIDRRVHTIRSASSQPLGSPTGRASTAQGIYGGTGTIALILASLAAGASVWSGATV